MQEEFRGEVPFTFSTENMFNWKYCEVCYQSLTLFNLFFLLQWRKGKWKKWKGSHFSSIDKAREREKIYLKRNWTEIKLKIDRTNKGTHRQQNNLFYYTKNPCTNSIYSHYQPLLIDRYFFWFIEIIVLFNHL